MLWLIVTIIAWGVVHSILASLSFKNILRRTLGDYFMRWYRLFYNAFSVVSFAPILYLLVILPTAPLYQIPTPWSYVMLAGQGFSAALLLVAVLQTDPLSFIGVRQLWEEEKATSLMTKGFYRYVRHPLYTFGLLALWLTPRMTVNAFVVYIVLTIYIFIGAFFEERKLLREFGQAYADYRSVTPMLVPVPKFNGNK